MQVGEIVRGAHWAIQRLHVRLQLDQISGNEARRKAQVAQDLQQQESGIAARSGALAQRLFGGLDARLQPDDVGNLALQPGVQIHQEEHRTAAAEVDGLQIFEQQGAGLRQLEKGREFLFQP